jgi:hypothetical protein
MTGRRGRDGTLLDETAEGHTGGTSDGHAWRPHVRTGPMAGYLGEDDDGRPMYCVGCRTHLRQLVRRGFDLADR